MKQFTYLAAAVNVLLLACLTSAQKDSEHNQDASYTIEGRVLPPAGISPDSWSSQTRVLANGGEFVGFLRSVYLHVLLMECYLFDCLCWYKFRICPVITISLFV